MLETPGRRREIEDTASALFRERGYAAPSVRDLARALDLEAPSLYAHVASKEDVLWAIVDRVATRFESAAAAASPSDDRQGPADRLRALVRAHVRVVTDDPGAASVFITEWRHLSAERRAAVLDRRDAYERRWRAVVEAGIADGAFALTDPAVSTTFVLTALNAIATWYDRDGYLSPAQLADAYADLALRALTEASL